MAKIALAVVPPKRPNGYVIYRGPSRLDGADIVVIVTGLRHNSGNGKTGQMLQTWILRADRSPIAALKDGADASICGDCPHRQVNGAGSCYVNVAQGPHAVWDAWQRGAYPVATLEELAELAAGFLVRVGSYGDPVAVPVEVWQTLLSRSAGHTGYTHQWRRALAKPYRTFLMASCDGEKQRMGARKRGWRTFRVKAKGEAVLPGEIVCPASEEAGKKRTCETCGACDGAAGNPARVSIVIDVHGLVWKAQRFERLQRAIRNKKRYRIK